MKPKFKIGDTVKVETQRLIKHGTVIGVEAIEHRGKEQLSYAVEDEYGSAPYLEKYLSLNVCQR